MSLRTWLIKLLGGEPRLSPSDVPGPVDRQTGDRVITATATVGSTKSDVADKVEEEEEIGSLSLTTEMDELLYLTSGSVTHFDLSGKGVSIVYSNGKLLVTDTLSSTIVIGSSQSGAELLNLPTSRQETYDVFFNQASANLIIAGKSDADRDDDCKLYLFPIDGRRISISRTKVALVVKEG